MNYSRNAIFYFRQQEKIRKIESGKTPQILDTLKQFFTVCISISDATF